ncbi:MAG: hypothetical protein Q8K63_10355, partial [Acidimicrobiales bacterium]|nr:hypothetical protein [Acidimicrobiales bacterium]
CPGAALGWFQDPARWDVALAADGPEEWQRVDVDSVPEARPITPVVVSDIEEGDTTISFRVDRPGTPVLVKTSYFPNWKAEGAKGPYRVTPNLMVVIPTSKHVSLHYGTTPVDLFANGLTLVGLAGLGGLWWWGRRPEPPASEPADEPPATQAAPPPEDTVEDDEANWLKELAGVGGLGV